MIEFSTSFGTFYLEIKATLPEHLMRFPEVIDFGYRPIRETAKINFTLENIGELTSYYEWSIGPPFYIAAPTGELAPGTSCSVLIEFKPKEAMVLDAVAICSFGVQNQWEKTKVVKSAKVFGISKFSHLICSGQEPVFDFGDVYIGTTSEKTLILKNPSLVHANFKIKRTQKDSDDCYNFSCMSGRVEAGAENEITIKYTPVAAGLYSNSYFDVTTMSGNTIRITASGRGLGPKVSVDPKILNFNDIAAGNTVTRVFYLRNDAAISTNYQVIFD